LALLVVGIIVVLVFGWPWLAAVALPVFLIIQAVSIVLAFRFRCPACDQRLLVQGFRTLHPARKILFPGIASWIAVAFDVARRQQLICMHCGERCVVKV
jgi:DNA-directed RNA polymerase subunit RPC12/RpoP